MVHEVPDKESFFRQLKSIMKEKGRVLLVEPKLFHVSRHPVEGDSFPVQSTLGIAVVKTDICAAIVASHGRSKPDPRSGDLANLRY